MCNRGKGWEWESNGRGSEWKGLRCVQQMKELGMGR